MSLTEDPGATRRVVLVTNPASGRGLGAKVAARFVAELSQAGHEVTFVADVRRPADRLAGYRELDQADAMAVVGGDGTVHHALKPAVKAQVPLYHIPVGTENLLARTLGWTRKPATLLRALSRGHTESVDLGACNGALFSIMVSVGMDASIVHRLARRRSGRISRLSYFPGIAVEAFNPHLPRLTILADGEPIVESRKGVAIVANGPRYGGRLDPARHASMHDGDLDLVFLPAKTTLRVLGWALQLWGRRAPRDGAFIARRAKRIEIHADATHACYQVDGEAPGVTPASPAGKPPRSARTPVRLDSKPGVLRILSPFPL